MKHHAFKASICFLLFSSSLTGCTQSGNSPSIVESITDAVKEIISPDSSVSVAEKQVSEIKKELNQKATYALTEDDVAFLKTEGLLSNENELKGWVK